MITGFFAWWFKLSGWKIKGEVPSDLKKAVVIAAPHTSNWDFLYALAVFNILKLKVNYLAKKELFAFPLSIILKATGGIPVERSKKQNLTDALISKFNNNKELLIMIPAEGTRKLVPKWKSGFYFTALGANVPVLPGYLDYAKKEAGFGEPIYLTGNQEIDTARFKEFYKDKTGKNPDQFSVDSIKIES
jgi:1-acyl-sn-glycerol-3-phosphate acyltransferase